MADEDFEGRACDNPKVIRAGGRYSPALEDAWEIDPTEGMCTGVHCNFKDVHAWRVSANKFVDRTEALEEQVRKRTIEEYESIIEAPPGLQELLQHARTVIATWRDAYSSYEMQDVIDYVAQYGEYIIGYWWVHWQTEPVIVEIITHFREAACVFDDLNDAYEEMGGSPATIPGGGKRPPPKDGLATPLLAAGLIGAAVFFGYQATKKPKGQLS